MPLFSFIGIKMLKLILAISGLVLVGCSEGYNAAQNDWRSIANHCSTYNGKLVTVMQESEQGRALLIVCVKESKNGSRSSL